MEVTLFNLEGAQKRHLRKTEKRLLSRAKPSEAGLAWKRRSKEESGVFARSEAEGGNEAERTLLRRRGGLAQLGERLPCKQEVSGSIPLISTN